MYEISGEIQSPNYPANYPDNTDEVSTPLKFVPRLSPVISSFNCYFTLSDLEPRGGFREEDQAHIREF